jgi:hypothetical protein
MTRTTCVVTSWVIFGKPTTVQIRSWFSTTLVTQAWTGIVNVYGTGKQPLPSS